ncbi:unnamed protein product [Ilex paraguariensis]|uniref:GPI inositol-deacylase n=1 Tax=Ilex paraguariensis TaxID=185542 RepID=A0ABC8UDT5_9AQUA
MLDIIWHQAYYISAACHIHYLFTIYFVITAVPVLAMILLLKSRRHSFINVYTDVVQEVSSMLLEKLVGVGIGNRPVVFVTHSMGGLVVKQMLYQAKAENKNNLVNNTLGVVFYSCPHFGSKLADMPWRMGLVFRPAPTIGELRSGSPRLVELNDFLRQLHKKGKLDVLSFCETKVTPIVEGYGGWAFRMEIVPIESAYPGFGELVVLESTDHINSCKPLSRADPSYKETLDFLYKLKAHFR